MTAKFLPKRSITPEAIPLSGDLDAGEIAVNFADGIIYGKNPADNLIVNLSGALEIHTHSIGQVEGLTDALTAKQDTLVSGTNIKTINGSSILGSGDIVIEGGGGGIDTSQTANFTAEAGKHYLFTGNYVATLPDSTALAAGTNVTFSKLNSVTPTIQVGAGTALIDVNGTTDTSLLFNVDATILVVFNGTNWEI